MSENIWKLKDNQRLGLEVDDTEKYQLKDHKRIQWKSEWEKQ